MWKTIFNFSTLFTLIVNFGGVIIEDLYFGRKGDGFVRNPLKGTQSQTRKLREQDDHIK